jgi:hypothetical protein
MEWISVKDSLPETYDFVLVLANFQGSGEPKPISIARLFPDRTTWDFLSLFENEYEPESNAGAYMDIEYSICSQHVTHWMPLPKPPCSKQEQNKQRCIRLASLTAIKPLTMDIEEIQRLLNLVPPLPWHFSKGDDFDHWELWSSHPTKGCHMVQNDSGIEPDDGFLEYVSKSRETIEYLLQRQQ